jgi:hypothetical protein
VSEEDEPSFPEHPYTWVRNQTPAPVVERMKIKERRFAYMVLIRL